MNVTLENLLIGIAMIIFSLLSYFISKTFKDLTTKLDDNSGIINELKLQLAIFTEKFGNSSFLFSEFSKRLEKLELEFRECKNKGCAK